MKKILMVSVMAAAAVSANAQWYIGGQLGLDFNKANKDADSQMTFSIAPEVGYNINENWAVGAQVGFSMANKLKEDGKITYDAHGIPTGVTDPTYDATGTSFFIAPYARYTFAKSGNVSFFVDGGIGFATANYDIDDPYEKYNESGTIFHIGLRPGIAFKATDKISFVATTGYFGYMKKSDDVYGGASRFGLNVNGNALQFGFYYNF
ncbi:MAG: porin family protein [Prevotella sp.]|nr:porin family protein [Prevotella sp.]